MLGAAIIVFRESFEAALLIGVLAAATRGLPRRGRWIVAGILVGGIAAIGVAALTGTIAALFDGIGQELFNVCVLGLAVAMLAWHNMWMAVHGAALAAEARSIGREVSEGRRTLSAILAVVAIAVLREGAETALFLYGLFTAGGIGEVQIVGGALLGLLGGISVGVVLYAGILRVPMRWFFAVTSGLILLLAASMAAQMARFLVQGELLPSLADPLWDTSSVVPADSVAGALLHAMAGYDPKPSGTQMIFYASTIVLILAGMTWVRRRAAARQSGQALARAS